MTRPLLLLLLASCAGPTPPAPDGTLSLRWYRADDAWTWDTARRGLWWSLSNLGADPADESAVVLLDEGGPVVHFALDPDVLPPEARPAVQLVVDELESSDEMALYGSVDVGRFLSRALDPWAYYAATGACATREEWEASRLDRELRTYAINASLLGSSERRVVWPASIATIADVVYRAEGGEGSMADGTFVPRDAEVVDFLPNGQQRYAAYIDGELAPAGDPLHTPAGSPTKCMWCHEEGTQPVSPDNTDLPGFASREQFEADRTAAQALVDGHRARSDVLPWAEWIDSHRESERLVDPFVDVAITQLAEEWSVETGEIRSWIDERGLVTTRVFEEDQLGDALPRDVADSLLAEVLPELASRAGHPFEGWEGPFEPIPVQPSRLDYDPAKSPDPEPFRALLDCR